MNLEEVKNEIIGILQVPDHSHDLYDGAVYRHLADEPARYSYKWFYSTLCYYPSYMVNEALASLVEDGSIVFIDFVFKLIDNTKDEPVVVDYENKNYENLGDIPKKVNPTVDLFGEKYQVGVDLSYYNDASGYGVVATVWSDPDVGNKELNRDYHDTYNYYSRANEIQSFLNDLEEKSRKEEAKKQQKQKEEAKKQQRFEEKMLKMAADKIPSYDPENRIKRKYMD